MYGCQCLGWRCDKPRVTHLWGWNGNRCSCLDGENSQVRVDRRRAWRLLLDVLKAVLTCTGGFGPHLSYPGPWCLVLIWKKEKKLSYLYHYVGFAKMSLILLQIPDSLAAVFIILEAVSHLAPLFTWSLWCGVLCRSLKASQEGYPLQARLGGICFLLGSRDCIRVCGWPRICSGLGF